MIQLLPKHEVDTHMNARGSGIFKEPPKVSKAIRYTSLIHTVVGMSLALQITFIQLYAE